MLYFRQQLAGWYNYSALIYCVGSEDSVRLIDTRLLIEEWNDKLSKTMRIIKLAVIDKLTVVKEIGKCLNGCQIDIPWRINK